MARPDVLNEGLVKPDEHIASGISYDGVPGYNWRADIRENAPFIAIAVGAVAVLVAFAAATPNREGVRKAEITPTPKKVAIIVNPENPDWQPWERSGLAGITPEQLQASRGSQRLNIEIFPAPENFSQTFSQ